MLSAGLGTVKPRITLAGLILPFLDVRQRVDVLPALLTTQTLDFLGDRLTLTLIRTALKLLAVAITVMSRTVLRVDLFFFSLSMVLRKRRIRVRKAALRRQGVHHDASITALGTRLSMGASKPATDGRFKTSQGLIVQSTCFRSLG